ncbi:hypothetical protein AX15_004473 [Amanita polypyramis BW_CC]|nr:hypothetical protein AX15_004473 [Amanita polypyramis BW_CC]
MTKSSSSSSVSMAFARRHRPPNINVAAAAADRNRRPVIHVQAESPLDDSDTLQLSGDELDDDTLQLSSSDSSSPDVPSTVPMLGVRLSQDSESPGDMSKDLAALQQLRKSVKTNLRLRPIRSNNSLPKVSLSADNQPSSRPPASPSIVTPSSSVWRDLDPPPMSPTSAVSCYFTPLSGSKTPPRSASLGPDTPSLPLDTELVSRPIPPGILYARLTSSTRPLLIDTRSPALHHTFHIRHSINVAIPTLILKRSRKPNGAFQSLDALRQFITTDQEKQAWDELMRPSGPWDGDVVVYDDEMDPNSKDNVRSTAWALMHILAPLLKYGFVNYLEGGINDASHHPDLEMLITTATNDISINEDPTPPKTPFTGGLKTGLFQLDTGSALRSKPLPEIEPSSASSSSSTTSPSPLAPILLPVIPAPMTTSTSSSLRAPQLLSSAVKFPLLSHGDIVDSSPSPPPSHITFRKLAIPHRRPSVPNLRRLDTNGVSGLSIRTKPMRSATLAAPPSATLLQVPAFPSHLKLSHSNYSPPGSARLTSLTLPSTVESTGDNSSLNGTISEEMTPYYTPPHTPFTPKPPVSPITPRPTIDGSINGSDESPPSSEEGYPTFTVSTILPNFLYLGPELTAPEHVDELRDLGVKRILNIAAECDDDHGLRLKEVFEKYIKIPMRDTVEEDNIAWGVREVCNFLDDARLHSAPTYVHCKAGKSRSVTAVMAYLIHANHWTLTRAYAFVLERRKGISPNIGFVSELMTFEERELGGKSIGVQSSVAAGAGGAEGDGNGGLGTGQQSDPYVSATHHFHHHRRGGHVRESLPPTLATAGMTDGCFSGPSMGPMSAGGIASLGDSAQELEIKDASGRYRHARRAPVDETTLQPGRRVSKAGLESSNTS